MPDQTIYELELHETLVLQSMADTCILRVPGGWLYCIESNGVFVPFDDEFQEKEQDNG